MIAQPDWKDVEEFRRFRKPRLGFFISSGNIDSMVNHYSVSKRRRKKDSYTPNEEMTRLCNDCLFTDGTPGLFGCSNYCRRN